MPIPARAPLHGRANGTPARRGFLVRLLLPVASPILPAVSNEAEAAPASSLTTLPEPARERSGLWLMVASAAAFAAMAAFVKFFLPHAPQQAVVLSRGVVMSVVFVAWALRRRVSIRGTRPARLFLRGVLGYLALSCYFFSVQRLPLGDAVLIQYSHPAFVAMLAPFFLGERTARGHWLAIAGALGGVALIVGPSGDLRGAALIGLLGSLGSGLAYLTVRDLVRTEHPLTILIWFPLATIPGALVGTILAGRAAIPQSGREWLGHAAVVGAGLVGQVTLTAGLARARAAPATAAALSGPVFGMLFGWILFGTIPSALSLGGAALVVGSLSLLGRKRPEARVTATAAAR